MSFSMGVPITHKMESPRETLVNLPLFGFRIWLVASTRPPVSRPRPRRLDDHNIYVAKVSEKLSSSFGLPEEDLAMPIEMSKHFIGEYQSLP